MYIVIEMTANRHNPQSYGEFVRICALVEDSFESAFNFVKQLLGVERLKTIHTVGVTGATHVEMAKQDIWTDREVQLFSEFQDPCRFWIFEAEPKPIE